MQRMENGGVALILPNLVGLTKDLGWELHIYMLAVIVPNSRTHEKKSTKTNLLTK